jgi:hypothetical protein
VEFGGAQTIYEALQRWYSAGLVKPEVLSTRGHVTIVDVQRVDNVDNKVAHIREWAKHVWDAYSSQQEMARRWVQDALNQKKR